MYDGSTATAEAVLMAHRITGAQRAMLSGSLHPHYAETVRTMAGLAGEIVTAPVMAPGQAGRSRSLIDDEHGLRRGAEPRRVRRSCAI